MRGKHGRGDTGRFGRGLSTGSHCYSVLFDRTETMLDSTARSIVIQMQCNCYDLVNIIPRHRDIVLLVLMSRNQRRSALRKPHILRLLDDDSRQELIETDAAESLEFRPDSKMRWLCQRQYAGLSSSGTKRSKMQSMKGKHYFGHSCYWHPRLY